MDHQSSTPSHRETLVSVLLGIMLAGMILFAVVLICGGFSFYILAVVGGLGLVGCIHYLLWGYSLDREVSGEREEEQLRSQPDSDSWTDEEPPLPPRRF